MTVIKMISGQIYGKVDWVLREEGEIGIFLQSYNNRQTRCVLVGQPIRNLIESGAVFKGTMICGAGEIYARSFVRKKDNAPDCELVCNVSQLGSALPRERRVAGSLNLIVKGRVDVWNEQFEQIKTYFPLSPSSRRSEAFVGVIPLSGLRRTMPKESLKKLYDWLSVGREFSVAGPGQAYVYTGARGQVCAAIRTYVCSIEMHH